MRPDLVVDIGNTRIKWGICTANGVSEAASLPHDDPDAWQGQLDRWKLPGSLSWAVAGVAPRRLDRLVDWIRKRGDSVVVIDRASQLPLQVALDNPDGVGIDRLLDAVALRAREVVGPAIIIDAGSAITVDWVDEAGAFRGGAILPGIQLMARALHDHTALLPIVEIRDPKPALPGTSTVAAIEAGILYGVAGAINGLIDQYVRRSTTTPSIYLTGGDSTLLKASVDSRSRHWPAMTLEGVLAAAMSVALVADGNRT